MKRSIKHKVAELLTVCALFFTCGVMAEEAAVSTTDLVDQPAAETTGFHTADELLMFAHNLTQCVNEQAGEGFNKNLSMEEIEGVIESYEYFIEICKQRLNKDVSVSFHVNFSRADSPKVVFGVNETVPMPEPATEGAVSTISSASETNAAMTFHYKGARGDAAEELTECVNGQADEGFNKNLSIEEVEGVIESYKQFVEVCNQRLNRDFPVHFGAYFNKGDSPSFEVFFGVTANETIFPEPGGEGDTTAIPEVERALALAKNHIQANRTERRDLREQKKELQQFQATVTEEALFHYQAFFQAHKDEMSEKEPFLTDQIHKMQEIYNSLLSSQQSLEEVVKQAQIANEEASGVFLEKSSAVEKHSQSVQAGKSALDMYEHTRLVTEESIKMKLQTAELALSTAQKELAVAEQAYKTAETALNEVENIAETMEDALESLRESLLDLHRDFFIAAGGWEEMKEDLKGQAHELKKRTLWEVLNLESRTD